MAIQSKRKSKKAELEITENKPKTFVEMLKELAESSSIHGIPKIATSRQIAVKVLWSLLFLATFSVFALQVFYLFRTYYEYGTKTKVEIEYRPLKFPAITFCNMNPIKLSKLDLADDLKDIVYGTSNKQASTSNNDDGDKKRKRKKRAIPTANNANIKKHDNHTDLHMKSEAGDDYDEVLGADTPSMTTHERNSETRDVNTELYNKEEGKQMPVTLKRFKREQGTSNGTDFWHAEEYKKGSSSEKWKDEYEEFYHNGGSNTNEGSSSSDGALYGDTLSFFWDEIKSPKDKWEQRAIQFQTILKEKQLDTRVKMGHMKEDMFLSSTFSSKIQNLTNFELFTSSEYGNCYTVDSDNYWARRSGPDHGLKFTFNLETAEYIRSLATGFGIRIVFHEQGTYPQPSEEGLTLSPGYETSIGLRMMEVHRMGEPYGQCTDGNEFYKKYNLKYSITACMTFCRFQAIIDNCGCFPHDGPDAIFHQDGNVSVCDNSKFSETFCVFKVNMDFDSRLTDCNCQSPCSETAYEKTMSGRLWPNLDYLQNVLMEEVCEKNLLSVDTCEDLHAGQFDAPAYRENFLRVLVYFEDLNFEKITQEPLYEQVRFVSDLGGTMGLFLGISVLSLFEFLQLLFEIGMLLHRKWKLKYGGADDCYIQKVAPTDKDMKNAPRSAFSKSTSVGIHNIRTQY